MKSKKIFSFVTKFNRAARIRSYISNMEEIYKPSKKKIEKVEPIKEKVNKTLVKATIVSWIRGIFNIIIYASAISAFSSVMTGIDLSFLSEQIKLVAGIVGGTAVAIVGATITSRLLNLYLIDMGLLMATIIAVYTSPEKDIDRINLLSAL